MKNLQYNTTQRLLTMLGTLLLTTHVLAIAHGQGVANRAVQRIQDINLNGPGYGYFGVNGADRGLGYIGSYMTAGGFIPTIGDDFGGIWNADVRGHLSVNGGFFSNVGAVRKQLLNNGALLGIGIFWDYDGDLYQYNGEDDIPGAIFGQFGHVYQQVGVSGELLTDWGNMRVNGYMPVGTTGHQLASSTTAGGIFYQNYMLPVNGLDAALSGADLELGAYVPALAQWAGMINVGGYAYGNTRYTKVDGLESDDPIVPWFGGVYTRLDMTFSNNWDFSLQYNNDSFFNSTGFARLTYRMGGSRRRNVPDQMEQPMFRNEHIVRAHRTPIAALNPQNNNQLWEVVHVDNTAAPNGDGTIESPFRTLDEAQAAGGLVNTNPWTITYVHQGSATSAFDAYTDSFAFAQPNQFLVGSGGPLTIAIDPIEGNSLFTIPALTTGNPILVNKNITDPYDINKNGASIVIAKGNGGATVANITTEGSIIGISASGDLNGTPQPIGTTANLLGSSISNLGGSAVRNVLIKGDGTAADQTGVLLAAEIQQPALSTLPATIVANTAPTGGIEFTDTQIQNTAAQSFQVGDIAPTTTPASSSNEGKLIANSGGDVNVDYYGSMYVNRAENGDFENTLILIAEKSGGTINIAAGGSPLNARVQNSLLDVRGDGIIIAENAAGTVNNIANLTMQNPDPAGIAVVNDNSTTSVVAVARTVTNPTTGIPTTFQYGISKNSGNAALIAIAGGSPKFSFFGTAENASPGSAPIIGMIGSTVPAGAFPYIDGAITNINNATVSIGGPGFDPLVDNAGGITISGISNSGGAAAPTTIDIEGALLRNTGVLMGTNAPIDQFTTTTFSDLNIEVRDDLNAAFVVAQTSGIITIPPTPLIIVDGNSTATNLSTAQPVISTTGGLNPSISMSFNEVISGVDNALGTAVDLTTANGTFTVTDLFTVGGSAGSAANINAPATVNVNIPP